MWRTPPVTHDDCLQSRHAQNVSMARWSRRRCPR